MPYHIGGIMPKSRPCLQFSITCDNVAQDKITGNFILHGIFDSISSKKFPARHYRLYVVNKWYNGVGKFTQNTQIVSPDGEVISKDNKSEFNLLSNDLSHVVLARFDGVLFKKSGTYKIEVYLDNECMLRYPLIVREVTNAG